MLEIKNTRVYDLKESIISCRNAMRLEMPEYTEEEFELGLERAKKLVKASKNSPNVKCHDNFMTGIRVSFDMKYTQYITKQFQRYHWFDYVSSSSLMHRITKMDFSKCCNKYVTEVSINQMKALIHDYNKLCEEIPDVRFASEERIAEHKQQVYEAWMRVLSNCPMGAELFVHVSTNYKQLQTIYFQRLGHKLKEDWGVFKDWVESLPYAHELIIGDV